MQTLFRIIIAVSIFGIVISGVRLREGTNVAAVAGLIMSVAGLIVAAVYMPSYPKSPASSPTVKVPKPDPAVVSLPSAEPLAKPTTLEFNPLDFSYKSLSNLCTISQYKFISFPALIAEPSVLKQVKLQLPKDKLATIQQRETLVLEIHQQVAIYPKLGIIAGVFTKFVQTARVSLHEHSQKTSEEPLDSIFAVLTITLPQPINVPPHCVLYARYESEAPLQIKISFQVDPRPNYWFPGPLTAVRPHEYIDALQTHESNNKSHRDAISTVQLTFDRSQPPYSEEAVHGFGRNTTSKYLGDTRDEAYGISFVYELQR